MGDPLLSEILLNAARERLPVRLYGVQFIPEPLPQPPRIDRVRTWLAERIAPKAKP